MRVAVVGAGGQLGAAVTRQFAEADADVLPLTRREVDLTSQAGISTLARWRPDVIVNCAAYNNVDGAEEAIEAAMAVNRDGVAALAKAADAAGAVLVHYGTDFVFDGEAREPYTELDRPNPISAYGRSKVAGEMCAMRAGRHYILRLSSVFGGAAGEGAGGRTAIDWIIDSTLAGMEIRAFSDRTVTPSYTADVAWATQRLVTAGAPVGVYHCVSSGWTTWAQLAGEVASALGVPARVRAVLMREMPMRARRPLRCALSNAKLASVGIIMPDWQDMLRRYLAVRRAAAPAAPPVKN